MLIADEFLDALNIALRTGESTSGEMVARDRSPPGTKIVLLDKMLPCCTTLLMKPKKLLATFINRNVDSKEAAFSRWTTSFKSSRTALFRLRHVSTIYVIFNAGD